MAMGQLEYVNSYVSACLYVGVRYFDMSKCASDHLVSFPVRQMCFELVWAIEGGWKVPGSMAVSLLPKWGNRRTLVLQQSTTINNVQTELIRKKKKKDECKTNVVIVEQDSVCLLFFCLCGLFFFIWVCVVFFCLVCCFFAWCFFWNFCLHTFFCFLPLLALLSIHTRQNSKRGNWQIF